MTLCTGGIVTDVGGYRIHKFTTVGNDTLVVVIAGLVEALVVAGGGGGGGENGGGGGAGGWKYSAALLLSEGNKEVTVGTGGTFYIGSSNTVATNGLNSVFGSLTATGGGHGASITYDAAGSDGGSGGGGVRNGTVGKGTAGQGNNGGGSTASSLYGTGGGGGAGAAGGTGNTSVSGGGGVGISTYSDLLIAANAGHDVGGVHYICGGGGGGNTGGNLPATAGGYGGGGGGDSTATGGVANTGGGGGGGRYDGANGGSGIVIVRYIPSVSASKFNFFFMKPVKQLWDEIGGIYRPKNTGIVTI